MSEMGDAPAIDADWLAERLAARGLPHDFDAIALEPLGRFSTELWRLRLVGAAGTPALVVKRAFRPPRSAEPPELEARLYAELEGRLPVPAPRFVAWRDGLLILTEVPGLLPFDFRAGASERHGERIADGLAALHAAFWERCEPLDFVPRLADPALRARWQVDFDRGWSAHRAAFDALWPGFTPIGDALVGRLAASLAPLAEPATLLHGDAHAENLPLAGSDGEAVFLDWQAPRIGSPGFDLAVFLAMSHPGPTRRRVERGLVERHAAALRGRGLAWRDPWSDYRRGLLRRAARIVEICADEGPGPLGFVYRRCARAAADHGVGELIA